MASKTAQNSVAITLRFGSKLIHEFPAGEEVLSVKEFHGTVYVATTEAIYAVIDGKLISVGYHKTDLQNS